MPRLQGYCIHLDTLESLRQALNEMEEMPIDSAAAAFSKAQVPEQLPRSHDGYSMVLPSPMKHPSLAT